MKIPILILLIIVSFNLCYSDTLPSHAVQGGLMTGTAIKLSGGSKTVTWIGFGVGAILGALPDIGGIYGGSLGNHWETYHQFHRFDTVISYIPQVRLHLLVDKLYHNDTGGWKKGMVTVAIISIIVEGILLYYFIKWVK